MTADPARATVVEAFQRISRVEPSATAIRTPRGANTLTWGEYAGCVRSLAAGLAALGLRPGDRVALVVSRRLEATLVDTAALHLGAVPFAVPSDSADVVADVLHRTRPRLVVTEKAFLGVVLESGVPIRHLVCVDGSSVGALTLSDVESLGSRDFDFEKSWRAVAPDDLCTLDCVPDANGNVRLAELTHRDVVTRLAAVAAAGVEFGDRLVAHQPAADPYGRLSHYTQLVYGVEVTLLPARGDLADAVVDARPTIGIATRDEWESLRGSIEGGLAGLRWWPIRLVSLLAPGLVLRRIRARHGLTDLRWGLCVGAPVNAGTLEYFLALGVPLSVLRFSPPEVNEGRSSWRPKVRWRRQRVKIGLHAVD